MPASASRGISTRSIASCAAAGAQLDARARHARPPRSRRRVAADCRARIRPPRSPSSHGRRKTRATDVAWQPLVDGETVDAGGEPLTVLHTPGHSPDHIAFWHEPTRAAFTGDLVIQGSSVMIPWSRGGDLADYLASLERLIALRPRALLPGARPGDRRSARGAVAAMSSTGACGSGRSSRALRHGHSTVPAIAESIYDGLDPALMPAASENVRAHLEKLKADGLAVDDGERWTGRSDGHVMITHGPTSDRERQRRRSDMDNVIDFINVNRERYLDELKALLAIPEHQRAARARRRRQALRRRGAPTRCGGSDCRTSA